MQKNQPKLYIRGVVAAQKHAQDMIRDGVPEPYLPEFRRQLKYIVQSVEEICRKHSNRPDELPLRTQKAYSFLKNLLEHELPKPQKSSNTPPRISRETSQSSFQLRGLLSYCQYLQDSFYKLTQQENPEAASKVPKWSDPQQIHNLPVFHEIQATLDKLDKILEKEKHQPADLAAPSLRAYQWLTFLNQPGNLQAHLLALSEIETIKAQLMPHTSRGKSLPLPALRIDFYNIPGLYRSQQKGPQMKLLVHEGFIYAPLKVLRSLLLLGANSQVRKSAAIIRGYANSKEFTDASSQLARIAYHPGQHSAGGYQDLQTVFSRVNKAYFNNQLSEPNLSWSHSATYRKFGHYVPSTDSIMISASLDDPTIPAYLLDFVMYHECLHKYLGYHTSNGRRMSHHAKFRQLEKQFPHFEQAQKALNEISQKISRQKRQPRQRNAKLSKPKTRH